MKSSNYSIKRQEFRPVYFTKVRYGSLRTREPLIDNAREIKVQVNYEIKMNTFINL